MPVFIGPSHFEQESIREALDSSREFIRGIVLDVGCGQRPYESVVKTQGSRYIGLDRTRGSTASPDVVSDSLELPFRSNSFDAVLSTQVLEHVVDPFRMMEEVCRVLKPGGHLVLTAPQVWPLHEEPNDFFRYTRYGLSLMARQAGLDTVLLNERHGGFYALAQLCSAMLYDGMRQRFLTRVLFKIVVQPFLSIVTGFDKLYYYNKLTLGYVLIARKRMGVEQ